MRDEHASTLQALVSWFRRQDDIGQVSLENYTVLADVADKWDIPMLLHDVDVLPPTVPDQSFSYVYSQSQHWRDGCFRIGMIVHTFENGVNGQ